jgi:GTPase SAR1 family protein
LLDYWKCVPDKGQVDVIVPVLNRELESFSEADKDNYAYFGDPESVSRIGSRVNETPVVRPNPAYWNQDLPKASIQLIVLEMPKPEEVSSKMEKYLKNGDGYYYVYRLLNELDVNSLLPLIAK